MGSSITLTLWAFLGMESAAQNSDAVENPKRDVPLACMFGTLGAAVVYVLSTTVIQGIVPNADLANSTGPFALAFAQMFNPTVGTIVMALAVIACLGSLLGWQFTIASTGKAAAEERMFPAFFAKVNSMGAPITGMIVLGVVQTAVRLVDDLADPERAVRRARQPVGRHQRHSVRRVVVRVDGDHESSQGPSEHLHSQHGHRDGRDGSTASSRSTRPAQDAVMGGMLVLGITYVVWGFIAPRFSAPAASAVPASPAKKAA